MRFFADPAFDHRVFYRFSKSNSITAVTKEVWMLWGAGIYVGLNLFVYDFKDVYAFGKSWVEKIFTFFKPAGYVVPVYSIFLIIIYEIFLILGRGASCSLIFYLPLLLRSPCIWS